MSSKGQERVSAQVALKPGDGTTIDEHTVITAENVSRFRPAREAVSRAVSAFSSMGFEVGELVGNSFSITGAANLFERTFGTSIAGGRVVREDGTRGYEFPLDALPTTLAADLQSVTFTPPPDFGPTNY